MASSGSDFYRGKLFAGPMVRASCLPFRLTCLSYGADACYGPATSADAILRSHLDGRTLYFGWPDNPYVHFRADDSEKGKLVFQLLASEPAQAVKAAEMVVGFADAIDLNCGCPETFATSRGAGSALMRDPQKVFEIVRALRSNFDIPISVKHRIYDKVDETIQLAVGCEQAGASAIAIHGRVKEQKHGGAVDFEQMKVVFDSLSVAKIGNGGVRSLEMAEEMKSKTGCDSVMICSAALKNPSIFSPEPKDPLEVARHYMSIAYEKCDDRREWRWVPLTMLGKYPRFTHSPTYSLLNDTKTIREFKEILDRDDPFLLERSTENKSVDSQ